MADVTTTSTSSPWDFLNPYFSQYMGMVTGALQNNPPQPYLGPTVAPPSQNQMTAWDMARTLAMQGSPAYNAATGTIGGMAGGSPNQYAMQTNQFQPLNNPYLEDMIGSSNADITRNWQLGVANPLATSLAQQGAFGGSQYNELMGYAGGELAKQIAANEASLRGGAYAQSGQMAENALNRQTGAFDTEQARRLQAASLGLGSQGTDLAAIQGLLGAGTQQQAYGQDVLGGMQSQWQQAQNAPYAASDVLGRAIANLMGGGGSTTTEQNGPGQSWVPAGVTAGAWLLSRLLGGG